MIIMKVPRSRPQTAFQVLRWSWIGKKGSRQHDGDANASLCYTMRGDARREANRFNSRRWEASSCGGFQPFFMFAAISFDGPGWRCLWACAWCCLWACWALPRRATGRGPLRLTHEIKKVVLTSTQDLSPCVGFWLLNMMGFSSRDGHARRPMRLAFPYYG